MLESNSIAMGQMLPPSSPTSHVSSAVDALALLSPQPAHLSPGDTCDEVSSVGSELVNAGETAEVTQNAINENINIQLLEAITSGAFHRRQASGSASEALLVTRKQVHLALSAVASAADAVEELKSISQQNSNRSSFSEDRKPGEHIPLFLLNESLLSPHPTRNDRIADPKPSTSKMNIDFDEVDLCVRFSPLFLPALISAFEDHYNERAVSSSGSSYSSRSFTPDVPVSHALLMSGSVGGQRIQSPSISHSSTTPSSSNCLMSFPSGPYDNKDKSKSTPKPPSDALPTDSPEGPCTSALRTFLETDKCDGPCTSALRASLEIDKCDVPCTSTLKASLETDKCDVPCTSALRDSLETDKCNERVPSPSSDVSSLHESLATCSLPSMPSSRGPSGLSLGSDAGVCTHLTLPI